MFQHYRAVLLIPDIYERQHVRDMMTVLLDRLGFGAAFACQVKCYFVHFMGLSLLSGGPRSIDA